MLFKRQGIHLRKGLYPYYAHFAQLQFWLSKFSLRLYLYLKFYFFSSNSLRSAYLSLNLCSAHNAEETNPTPSSI